MPPCSGALPSARKGGDRREPCARRSGRPCPSCGAKRRGQAWSSGCPGPSCGRTVTECLENTLADQAVVRCCADAEGCILKPTAQPTALGR